MQGFLSFSEILAGAAGFPAGTRGNRGRIGQAFWAAASSLSLLSAKLLQLFILFCEPSAEAKKKSRALKMCKGPVNVFLGKLYTWGKTSHAESELTIVLGGLWKQHPVKPKLRICDLNLRRAS